MKSYILKQKHYLSRLNLKILAFASIFILLIILFFLLSAKIADIDSKKNNLLKYSTLAYISINDLHNNIANNSQQVNFDSIKKLKKSLLNTVINITKHSSQSIFFYNNDSANIINNIEFLWKDILFDLNRLLDNEEKTYTLFTVLEQIHTLLLQTKIDCKAMIEEMLVINTNANKISLAQQTIWLAERITNNIEIYMKAVSNIEFNNSFTKDVKNLFNIIDSLKNGNSLINTTKIEDKNVVNYLSRIDINLQKIIVLFNTIDEKLITLINVKAISEAITLSTIKFNEYLISLNNVLLNSKAFNNIFLFIYVSLLLLIILTLLATSLLMKQRCIKQTDICDYNSDITKLVADIESLSLVNLSLKTIPKKQLIPLKTAINKYISHIAQHLNKIYDCINYIAKFSVNIDKYKNLKVNCLSNITTKVTKQTDEIKYLINQYNKIINTTKDYTNKTDKLMLLIDKLPTMLKILNHNSSNLQTGSKTIKQLITTMKTSNELVNELYDNFSVFILNYELQGYNLDDKTNKITEIQDKLKKLQKQQVVVSSRLASIDVNQDVSNIITKLKLILNDLLATNKKLLQPHKQITSQLATAVNKHDASNNEALLSNIELIDKAFSQLLNDKQQIKATIDNLEKIKKYST